MPFLTILKEWAYRLKSEIVALYLAARDARTPWYAKLVATSVAAYALSPIDLIPDFIPVLGYLDDLILLPLGIALAIRLIPPPVLAECRVRAQKVLASGKPVSRIAGMVIVILWVVGILMCTIWLVRYLR